MLLLYLHCLKFQILKSSSDMRHAIPSFLQSAIDIMETNYENGEFNLHLQFLELSELITTGTDCLSHWSGCDSSSQFRRTQHDIKCYTTSVKPAAAVEPQEADIH